MKGVSQKHLAVAAELVRFMVHVRFTPAVVHEADRVRAVTEVEGVAEFVDHLLCHAGYEAFFRSRAAALQPVARNDACLPVQLGFTEHIGENGDEQVDPAQGGHLDGVIGRLRRESVQDGGAVVPVSYTHLTLPTNA